MATDQLNGFFRHLRTAMLLQDGDGMTDAQLLGRFIEGRDEAAVEALLRRHGPIVLGVCRRVLRHHQDAEDAFQATFSFPSARPPLSCHEPWWATGCTGLPIARHSKQGRYPPGGR